MSSIGDIETYKRRGRKTVRVKDMSTIGASAGIHTFFPSGGSWFSAEVLSIGELQ